MTPRRGLAQTAQQRSVLSVICPRPFAESGGARTRPCRDSDGTWRSWFLAQPRLAKRPRVSVVVYLSPGACLERGRPAGPIYMQSPVVERSSFRVGRRWLFARVLSRSLLFRSRLFFPFVWGFVAACAGRTGGAGFRSAALSEGGVRHQRTQLGSASSGSAGCCSFGENGLELKNTINTIQSLSGIMVQLSRAAPKVEPEQSTEEAACRRATCRGLEIETPPLNALALGAKRHYTDGRDPPRRRTCFRFCF